MSILAANLRHLYQRRGLWLVYAFLGLLVFGSIMLVLDNPIAGKGRFTWFIMIAFLTGFFATALVIEVLTKPFSYCLPGHRKTVRKFIFWIGIVINFSGSLLFLAYPGLLSWEPLLIFCSAFCANLIFYWLGVGLAFISRNTAAAIGYLWFAWFAGMFFDLHITLESAVVLCPVAVICVGLLTSIMAWFLLGDAGLARRYCDVTWIGFMDALNRDKIQRYRKARLAKKWDKKLKTHPNPWVERFFLGQMNKCDYVGPGRYIWGGLYTTFAVAMSQWKGGLSGLFAGLLMVCFLGYMGSGANILFFMPVFMLAHIRLPVYSSMLVAGGRNERFFTAMTLAATIAVLTTALVTIIAAFSLPLAAIMPDITLRGGTFTFHTMHIELFFVPLMMIPIVFTIQLFFFKNPYFVTVTIMLLFTLLFFTGIFLCKALIATMNPISIASLLVLSWVIFVTVLHCICMRRCLVWQGRTY